MQVRYGSPFHRVPDLDERAELNRQKDTEAWLSHARYHLEAERFRALTQIRHDALTAWESQEEPHALLTNAASQPRVNRASVPRVSPRRVVHRSHDDDDDGEPAAERSQERIMALDSSSGAIEHQPTAVQESALGFVGVGDPERECFIPDGMSWEDAAPLMFAAGDRIDSYRDEYTLAGYDPERGFGTESSRPPDYDQPEDEVAYPFGVLHEGTPEFEDAMRDEAVFRG